MIEYKASREEQAKLLLCYIRAICNYEIEK